MGKKSTALTPAKKKAFLARLAVDPTGNISRCARGVASASTVYRWRNEDPAFAAAWLDAVQHVFEEVKDAALTRVVDGVPEMLLHEGRPIIVHFECCGDFRADPDKANCKGEPLVKRKFPESLTAKFLTALDREDRFRDRRDVKLTAKAGVLVVPAPTSPQDWEKAVAEAALGAV